MSLSGFIVSMPLFIIDGLIPDMFPYFLVINHLLGHAKKVFMAFVEEILPKNTSFIAKRLYTDTYVGLLHALVRKNGLFSRSSFCEFG